MPQGKGTYGNKQGRPPTKKVLPKKKGEITKKKFLPKVKGEGAKKKNNNFPRVEVRSTNARKKVKAAVKKLAEFSNPLLAKAAEAAKKKMKARRK
tara:strand:- start:1256 stop:1540 length:285 start_codon:yes stop_codon:yes gene_type:complete